MQQLFYWLLELKTSNGIPLYIAYFKDGFAMTTTASKACMFANAKHARAYLEDFKKKYPEFLGYDKIKIEEHGFDYNPMAGQ